MPQSRLTAVVVLWAAPALAGPLTDRGTQPPLSSALRNAGQCSGCHGGYDTSNHIEPYDTWSGSMMAQASRDPLFWAAVDVANNDLPGSGDFCLRCHVPFGWLDGRSEPPGGSVDGCSFEGKLDEADKDFQGLSCHFCHRMMINLAPPSGEQPFYLENGHFWIDDEGCGGGGGQPCRRGPYDYPQDGSDLPPHRWVYASYQEEGLICGNCHNVTNPVLNLIDGAGNDTGVPFPIERTYREWTQSDFGATGSPDFKTCQNCHMPDATVDPAYACDSRRNNHSGDLPVHEFAGGGAWMSDVLRQEYPALDREAELLAARDASLRLLQQESATVDVFAPANAVAGVPFDLQVRITNLTGHKLPTGYPEGRRMWVHLEVRDGGGSLLFESGAYDSATGELAYDAQAKIYQTKVGIWDHNGTGSCDITNASGNPLFHFVLNNCVVQDNRIPPMGFIGGSDIETQPVNYDYPEVPVGSGILAHWDDTDYSVPLAGGTTGPLSVNVRFYYQTTSKEYVDFLRDQAVTHGFPDDCIERDAGFLTVSRGELMHDLWTRYGRSPPVEVGSAVATIPVGGPECGNNTIETGETCDPPASCPSDCDDGNSCTVDTLSGHPTTCDAACSHTAIAACNDADGCCPAICSAIDDDDCSATCDNGLLEPGETCDPPASCPNDCDDGNSCTVDALTGSAANCNAVCTHTGITACTDGDSCCPGACNALNDNDCSATCGNGLLEPGETCDPASNCPTSCADGNSCTIDSLTGSAQNCNAVCLHDPVISCVEGDNCCPAGCNATVDADCSATCDNGFVEPGETCDPPASCPATCTDGNACTVDALIGSAANCNAACQFEPIVSCQHGDGCCPAGCDAVFDDDCSALCGNEVVEPGETCDPPLSCPSGCDDGNHCTNDNATGSAQNCNVGCSHEEIVSCAHDDGCCPGGCDAASDSDCSATCANDLLEPGETCDPPSSCPTTCDDGNACTLDSLTGAAENCSAACTHNAVTTCSDSDGCCPAGCEATIDSDCSATCGNGTVESDETCDPPSSCPTTCDDGSSCTLDTMTGSAVTCSVGCSYNAVTGCQDDDGCCPPGCDAGTDLDCSPTCGNGTVDVGETCDPPSSCPSRCNDGDPCTADQLTGSAANCNVECSFTPVTACAVDGCCPSACDATNDVDCDRLPPSPGAEPDSGCGCAGGPAGLPWLLVALLLRRRRGERARELEPDGIDW